MFITQTILIGRCLYNNNKKKNVVVNILIKLISRIDTSMING